MFGWDGTLFIVVFSIGFLEEEISLAIIDKCEEKSRERKIDEEDGSY